MSKDGGTNTLISSRLSCGIAAPIGREAAVRLFESAFAFDTMEVGHIDYSVKPSKFIVSVEQEHMELLQQNTVLPLFYGFMPNLGLYYKPDGPFDNPSDLMPKGQIAEARATQEEALEACCADHDAACAHHAHFRRKQMHAAAATARATGGSAVELRNELLGRDLGECVAVAAVGAEDHVVVPKLGHHADSGRFLADIRVAGARNQSLLMRLGQQEFALTHKLHHESSFGLRSAEESRLRKASSCVRAFEPHLGRRLDDLLSGVAWALRRGVEDVARHVPTDPHPGGASPIQ